MKFTVPAALLVAAISATEAERFANYYPEDHYNDCPDQSEFEDHLDTPQY